MTSYKTTKRHDIGQNRLAKAFSRATLCMARSLPSQRVLLTVRLTHSGIVSNKLQNPS